MTEKQRVEIRLSEVKNELNTLGSKPELTDEDRTQFDKLKGEYGDLELRFQALTLSDDTKKIETTDKPEDVEKRQLIERCNVGSIFAATVEHRQTDGAEKELQTELGLSDNQIPLALLEKRVEAKTQAPSSTGKTQSEIIPYVYPDGMSAWLGVPQPTVPTGVRTYPVLTTGATVGTPAEDAEVEAKAAVFAATDLSPARIQAAFFYSREDRATFAGMDSALRENLSMALSDQLDQQVIAELIKDGKAVDKSGAVVNYGTFLDMLTGAIDGRIASMKNEIKILLGAKAWGLADVSFANSTTQLPPTALQRLEMESGGVRVGFHIPAVASKKQKQIVRRGMRMDAVSPIWEGVTLIPDEITRAAKGHITVTAVMLYAVEVLRADGFNIVELKTAA